MISCMGRKNNNKKNKGDTEQDISEIDCIVRLVRPHTRCFSRWKQERKKVRKITLLDGWRRRRQDTRQKISDATRRATPKHCTFLLLSTEFLLVFFLFVSSLSWTCVDGWDFYRWVCDFDININFCKSLSLRQHNFLKLLMVQQVMIIFSLWKMILISTQRLELDKKRDPGVTSMIQHVSYVVRSPKLCFKLNQSNSGELCGREGKIKRMILLPITMEC